MREGEEGGGRRGLWGHHVSDPRGEHGLVGGGVGGGRRCDRIGLLGDEVRDEVRKLAVEGDVELLPAPLAFLARLLRLLLQVSVHAGVLRVIVPPTLRLHLHGGHGQVSGRYGDGLGCRQVGIGLLSVSRQLLHLIGRQLGGLGHGVLANQKQRRRAASCVLPR